MAVLLTITYPGTPAVGCPTSPSGGWVLHSDGTWADPAIFRRWDNSDGNDCEVHFTNSGGTIVTNYVRIWNGAGEVVIDKSSGSWVLSGTCIGFTPPCNFVFQLARQRWQCLRAASRLPITATLTGSGIVSRDQAGPCGNGIDNYDCDSSPVAWANAARNFNFVAGTPLTDGLVYLQIADVGDLTAPCDGVTEWSRLRTILTQGAAASLFGEGQGCAGDFQCTALAAKKRCFGQMNGNLNMASDTAQAWYEDFNQVVNVSDAQGHTGTVSVEIPW